MLRFFAISAVALLSLCLMTAPAHAAAVEKIYFSQAVTVCQPALPAFDGLIRKRPKAVANEGTTTAFVTCGITTPNSFVRAVRLVLVSFTNRAGAATTINCTLVDGFGDDTYSPSKVKSLVVATQARGSLTFESFADNGNVLYLTPALSCALPPGTEISGVTYAALDEIGN